MQDRNSIISPIQLKIIFIKLSLVKLKVILKENRRKNDLAKKDLSTLKRSIQNFFFYLGLNTNL